MEEETEEREQTEDTEDSESNAQSKASDHEEADKEAEEKVKELEDDPPKSLDDWPDDQAKYKTFGGPDSETGYQDGPTANLGHSDVRYHEDGTVTVAGEKVDNPDDYKGDPIPGGPTDPNTPKVSGEQDLTGQGEGDDEGGDDSENSESRADESEGKSEDESEDKSEDKDE